MYLLPLLFQLMKLILVNFDAWNPFFVEFHQRLQPFLYPQKRRRAVSILCCRVCLVVVLIIDISMCWYIDIWRKLGILCLVDISINCDVDTLLYWLMYCVHMLIHWCVAVLICWYTDVVVCWYCHVREHRAPMLDR